MKKKSIGNPGKVQQRTTLGAAGMRWRDAIDNPAIA
jgi:hypothetical protein